MEGGFDSTFKVINLHKKIRVIKPCSSLENIQHDRDLQDFQSFQDDQDFRYVLSFVIVFLNFPLCFVYGLLLEVILSLAVSPWRKEEEQMEARGDGKRGGNVHTTRSKERSCCFYIDFSPLRVVCCTFSPRGVRGRSRGEK